MSYKATIRKTNFSFQTVYSQREQPHVLYEGHSYSRKKKADNVNGSISWRCTQKLTAYACTATCVTEGDKITSMCQYHNHPPMVTETIQLNRQLMTTAKQAVRKAPKSKSVARK